MGLIPPRRSGRGERLGEATASPALILRAHGPLRLKYRKSGGGWSLRVGISLPSALRK